MESSYNELEVAVKQSPSIYSFRYRLLKTGLLILAWISFGMSFELIGSTLEDLKLYLDVDYKYVSFTLVIRNIGYLLFVFLSGFLLDKFTNYSDLLMAISSIFIALPGVFIPITKWYLGSVINFFIQGVASSMYDLGGNFLILSLWKGGKSNSPINVMHAGYGIGATLSVQLAKPFIKFNPNEKLNSSEIKKNVSHVDLTIPFWTCSTVAFILSFLFLVAQSFEKKLKLKAQIKETNLKLKKPEVKQSKSGNFFKRLVFGKESTLEGKALAYMITQIGLITLLLFFLQGNLTILSKFMLTYLTKGPAKFSIDEYTSIQSLFWMLFIVARIVTTFLAYRLNTNWSLFYVFMLCFLNMFFSFLFLVPYLTQFKLFFFINIILIGIVSSPTHPCMFMVARFVLNDYNSFVISIFSIGVGLSSVLFQQLTGDLLDHSFADCFMGFQNFNSSYIIAYVIFVPAFFCFILFFIIVLVYRKYFHLVQK